MKTKIIPFDLETAKKIQAGEIEGKIKTVSQQNVRIICWDRMFLEAPLIILVQKDNYEFIYDCDLNGRYIERYGDTSVFSHLVLEVPDNEPQFKPFDRVLVRNNYDTSLWKPSFFVKDCGECFETVGEQFYGLCIPYEGNEHLVGTTDKPNKEE